MRKSSCLITTFVVVCSLLSAAQASDDLIETKAYSTPKVSWLKTAVVGALMLSAPAAVEAQNPGFVGCYIGTANPTSASYPGGNSNNISMSSLSTTNWNYYYTTSNTQKVYFYGNSYQSGMNGSMPIFTFYTKFDINIECDKESYCKDFYIKTVRLCEKIFDVNYYASMIYNPTSSTTSGASTSHYLAVWDSLSTNNTIFDQVFSSYMKYGNCTSPTLSTVNNPAHGR